MKEKNRQVVFLSLAIALLASAAPTSQSRNRDAVSPVEVSGGSVSFEVATNLFATTVRGKSSALKGWSRVHESGSGLLLEEVGAVVPVASLRTGIKVRDTHMQEYIFETTDGQVPDISFSADKVECSPTETSAAYTCVTSGTLAIRATSRPFATVLSVVRQPDGYRISADGRIALSQYGIERPSQFGVKTDDEVRIHLEFIARNMAPATAALR
jgi:polyisoprenoid-binding protein YceI